MTRLVVRDKYPEFSEVVGLVSQSIIAIGVGTYLSGSPQIIGTGFAIEYAEFFSTCWHVANVHDELSHLTDAQLKERGLKDAKLRIAIPVSGKYLWQELPKYTWLRGRDEKRDTCIFRLLGIAIPPLSLHQEAFILGTEVGVIGFPMGNALQGSDLRPIVVKTTLAGGIDPTPANQLPAAQVMLAMALAGGFSGAPVFSTSDGVVLGMVASKPLESSEEGVWPAGLSLAVTPGDISAVLRSGIDTTTRLLKEALITYLKTKESAT